MCLAMPGSNTSQRARAQKNKSVGVQDVHATRGIDGSACADGTDVGAMTSGAYGGAVETPDGSSAAADPHSGGVHHSPLFTT